VLARQERLADAVANGFVGVAGTRAIEAFATDGTRLAAGATVRHRGEVDAYALACGEPVGTNAAGVRARAADRASVIAVETSLCGPE
jgi:hypothetical protein